ncbi:MAG TPA: hypothetical protein PLV15_07230, partial [Smithella sp.]|nr:hypothetical protein [Smithella sp.]
RIPKKQAVFWTVSRRPCRTTVSGLGKRKTEAGQKEGKSSSLGNIHLTFYRRQFKFYIDF